MTALDVYNEIRNIEDRAYSMQYYNQRLRNANDCRRINEAKIDDITTLIDQYKAMKFFYCQREIECNPKCEIQCDHCKEYYKPLENNIEMKWKSVKDELPETSDKSYGTDAISVDVLVIDELDNQITAYYNYSQAGNGMGVNPWSDIYYEMPLAEKVTHWTELPNKPTK